MDTTNKHPQPNDRLTINLPPEVRSLVDQHRRQLEKTTGIRLSLSQSAAALVRRGAVVPSK